MPHSALRRCALACLFGVLAFSVVSAEVTRVDIARRAVVGTSGYEKLIGTVQFAVDPRLPANAVIADIDRAPVNAAGLVEFSADFYALRPIDAAASNGVALMDVLNRGRKTVITSFNRGGTPDPATEADLGDLFLMQRGFTVIWVGWEFDVPPAGEGTTPERGTGMRIRVPDARGVTGVIRASFTPNEAGPQMVTDLTGYRPADDAAADITLTVRDGEFGTPAPIARERFTLRGNEVTLTGGFEKGRTYELAYRPAAWPIAGLGLAAFRDMASWVKHAPDAVVRAPRTIAFGSSQSGRFLRSFLYHGFNADERGRQVLDGAMVHIAGAGRLSINERGAVPTSLSMFSSTQFPYATTAERDPISGRTDGLLENPRARHVQPKVMFTNTAVEYWGGGRAAALVHTSADGTRDLELPANVRAYFLTGTQHGPARFPVSAGGNGQQRPNPVEYWWTMRALLVAMTDWVTKGTEPPASQVPRLSDGTLVPITRLAFPAIPGVQGPAGILGPRVDGHDLPFLVPQVDADGNELAGIRTAEQRVPVATYTGWNFRHASIGAPTQVVYLLGSSIPFAATRDARIAANDPRPSLEERYTSDVVYREQAAQITATLIRDRYLLASDAEAIAARIREQWAGAK